MRNVMKMHELDFDRDEQLQHYVIQKYRKLLERISDNRVFAVMTGENEKFFLIECCDKYFGYDLTKKECIELSELFRELADEYKK